MTREVFSVCWVAGFWLLGCGSAAVPQEQLTAAQASVKGAEVAGAAAEPQAALYLKLANEEIDKAKALIADDRNEEALGAIDRAQADADLALTLAKEASAKKEVQEAKEQIEELKQRMNQ